MDDTALRAALQKLLAQGEMADDNKLRGMAAAKKAPPPPVPCPECAKLPDGQKCEECQAKEAADGDGDELAGLLEQDSPGG